MKEKKVYIVSFPNMVEPCFDSGRLNWGGDRRGARGHVIAVLVVGIVGEHGSLWWWCCLRCGRCKWSPFMSKNPVALVELYWIKIFALCFELLFLTARSNGRGRGTTRRELNFPSEVPSFLSYNLIFSHLLASLSPLSLSSPMKQALL